MPRRGMTLNHYINTKAGVIDPDYHGNITIILHNYSQQPYNIRIGDRIAQLIFYNISQSQPLIQAELNQTICQDHGFGSTDMTSDTIRQMQSNTSPAVKTQQNPYDMPFDIWMSPDPLMLYSPYMYL
jgi:hypothetical protein